MLREEAGTQGEQCGHENRVHRRGIGRDAGNKRRVVKKVRYGKFLTVGITGADEGGRR